MRRKSFKAFTYEAQLFSSYHLSRRHKTYHLELRTFFISLIMALINPSTSLLWFLNYVCSFWLMFCYSRSLKYAQWNVDESKQKKWRECRAKNKNSNSISILPRKLRTLVNLLVFFSLYSEKKEFRFVVVCVAAVDLPYIFAYWKLWTLNNSTSRFHFSET